MLEIVFTQVVRINGVQISSGIIMHNFDQKNCKCVDDILKTNIIVTEFEYING